MPLIRKYCVDYTRSQVMAQIKRSLSLPNLSLISYLSRPRFVNQRSNTLPGLFECNLSGSYASLSSTLEKPISGIEKWNELRTEEISRIRGDREFLWAEQSLMVEDGFDDNDSRSGDATPRPTVFPRDAQADVNTWVHSLGGNWDTASVVSTAETDSDSSFASVVRDFDDSARSGSWEVPRMCSDYTNRPPIRITVFVPPPVKNAEERLGEVSKLGSSTVSWRKRVLRVMVPCIGV